MFRRVVNSIALFGLGAFLMVQVGIAAANHVNEPQHPITGFELIVERYDTDEHLDCSGGLTAFPVAPSRKLRISPIVESASAWAGPVVNGVPTGVPGHHDPSEHFAVGWQLDQRIPNPSKPNVFTWEMEERTVWDHSNIPGDTESSKFNTAYATITPGAPNGGSSTNLEPGVYRLKVELLGDVSGKHFVGTCGFTIV